MVDISSYDDVKAMVEITGEVSRLRAEVEQLRELAEAARLFAQMIDVVDFMLDSYEWGRCYGRHYTESKTLCKCVEKEFKKAIAAYDERYK